MLFDDISSYNSLVLRKMLYKARAERDIALLVEKPGVIFLFRFYAVIPIIDLWL